MRRISFALPVLLAGTALAQSPVTVPPGYAAVEGGSYHWQVGQYDYARAQQILARAAMPAAPFVIKAFKLRRDGLRTTAFEAHTCDMEVFMSNRAMDPADACSLDWALNHGPDYMLVMKKQTISWPAEPLPATPPAPFTILFALDKPMTYTGKAFVIEWTSDFTTLPPVKYNWNWVTDAELDSAWAGGYVTATPRTFGAGCPTDFNNYGYFPYPGSQLWKYGNTRAVGLQLPCVVHFGVSDKTWGSSALPIDLAPYGAPGCGVYVDFVASFAAQSDPAGTTGRVDFKVGTIPLDPGLTGQKYMVQMFALDPAFNAMGLRASPGREYTIGTGFTGKTAGFCVYSYKSSATSTVDLADRWAGNYSARVNILELQ